MLRGVIDAVKAYAAHPDPRVETANFVALLVASNQPFYPLYLWWLVSDQVWPSYYTFLSTPFFLAVPAVARLNGVMGRALLPLAGIANGILCAKLFGVRSGVEIFLIPCAVLALLLFRPHERLAGYAVTLAAFLAYFVLHDAYGDAAIVYSAEEYAAFQRLNATSAAALTACVALIFSNLLARAEVSAEAARGEEPG